MFQLSTPTVLLLLFCFYGLTFLVSLRVGRKDENVDGYMVSNNSIGFGMAAASMTATWIWAASFYAAASSGYKFGLSGALHYGFWGALMILFIYPFGRRFRELAPKAHTLAEIMHARHGRSSQMILAGSNIVGSMISLMVNFTAAGALVAVLSPLSFIHGVLIAGFGILGYTIWSGFRSSVLTDFGQLIAMIFAALMPAATGFANWMRTQTQEEMMHAMKIYDFVFERGGKVTLEAIDKPPFSWDSPLAAFKEVLKHEQHVTSLINDLVDLAIKEKDHASNIFLQWFVTEQVEEEASADAVIQRLKLAKDNASGLFMIDAELGQRVFTMPAADAAA